MCGKKVFAHKSGKERSAICDIMREAHSCGYHTHGTVLIAVLQTVKRIEHIEAAQGQSLANVFHRRVGPERVIHTPITVRDRRTSIHGFNRGSILFRSEERRVGKECRSRW